ncbi:MAG: Glycerate kinase [Naasia sp.]|nr:Glycerate kinase [Naasia sp.]
MIAPDSFKGSLTAREAADALAAGWAEIRPRDDVVRIPQADGGEGTLAAVAAVTPDAVLRAAVVAGPDGRPVPARWLELPGRHAVIELAESSGLPLMAAPDAAGAGTRGLGEVIRAALDAGAQSLTIGLGGSASTDGGAGALAALGLVLADSDGAALPPGGAALARLAALDSSRLLAPPPGVRLLTDVTNPLLGPDGAAAVFGPQKGATPEVVERLDAALANFAALAGGNPAAAGAGAAGGTAYGFATFWGARIEPGAAAIAELSGLQAALAGADVVVTGEGRFDATSPAGKVVGHLLGLVPASARAVLVAGRIDAPAALPDGRRAEAVALVDLAPSPEAAMADAAQWLRVAGAEAARRSRVG